MLCRIIHLTTITTEIAYIKEEIWYCSCVLGHPSPSNEVFLGRGPSNHDFVKDQVGGTLFLFVYVDLVTGN